MELNGSMILLMRKDEEEEDAAQMDGVVHYSLNMNGWMDLLDAGDVALSFGSLWVMIECCDSSSKWS
jgi:hypothetical protein